MRIIRNLLPALLYIAATFYFVPSQSQNVGIGSTSFTPDSKALLELRGTGWGILIPRMAWVSRPAGLAAAQDGLLIYSTDGDGTNGKGYYYWDGTGLVWRKIGLSSSVNGTTNYVAKFTAANAIGNSQIFDNGTSVGVGNAAPAYKLDVSGDIRSTNKIWANANGASYFRGGDDAELWDVNVANTMGVYGVQNSDRATIRLGSGGADISGLGVNVGIGTLAPGAKLEVAGQVKITGGAPGAGKVLTSDATGLASWNYGTATVSSTLHPSMDDIVWTSTLSAGCADDAAYVVNWGFNFTIDGVNYTQGWISTNGILGFGTASSTGYSNTALPASISADPMLFFHWDDNGADLIRYVIQGTAPNRNCFIQWQGSDQLSCGGGVNRIMVYITISEGSNVVSVRYLAQGSAADAQGAGATFGFQYAGGAAARSIPMGYNTKLLDDNASNQHFSIDF